MSDEKFDPIAFLSSMGSLTKLKLPSGVVGKTSMVLVVSIICLTTIGFKANNIYLSSVIIAMIFVLVFIIVLKLISFANKNPHAALLEGAEFICHEQMNLASKNMKDIVMIPENNVEGKTVVIPPKDMKLIDTPDTYENKRSKR